MITFEALIFGDIIRYKDADYIFLAKTEDIIYLANILDKEITKQLKQREESLISQSGPNIERKLNSLVFCYIMLETEEFKGKAAHFGKPGYDNSLNLINKLAVRLSKEDIANLRNAVIQRPPNVELKELVEQITLP